MTGREPYEESLVADAASVLSSERKKEAAVVDGDCKLDKNLGWLDDKIPGLKIKEEFRSKILLDLC